VKRVVVAAVLTAALVVSACGSDDNRISQSASLILQSDVGAVRKAAASGDAPQLRATLLTLRQRVAQLRARNLLSASRQATILRAADAVAAHADLVPTTPPTTTAPGTTTAPASTHHRQGDGGNDHGHGHDGKKGHHGGRGTGDD
jgi:hypothetical protein